jgi:hypothetical protein
MPADSTAISEDINMYVGDGGLHIDVETGTLGQSARAISKLPTLGFGMLRMETTTSTQTLMQTWASLKTMSPLTAKTMSVGSL